MKTDNLVHKKIRISGRVQGVGFRYSTRDIASFWGINGFVSNTPYGEVYIEAEGDPQHIEEFLAWCNQGPPRAIIKSIDIYDGEVVGFDEFIIK